jgi:ATP-dependent Clp protease ATP-binding subunit ClpE
VTVGFGANEALNQTSLLDSLSSYFKPEFLNRFDAIIEFKQLEKDHLMTIVDLMLDELQTTLTEQKRTLHVSAEAKEKLADLGYHPSFGARPLRRALQDQVEDRLTDLILEDDTITNISVTVENDEISVSV